MKSVLQWSFFLCIAAFFFFSGWYVLFKLKPIDLSFPVMGLMLLNATFMSSATIAVATFFCAMLNVANDQLSKLDTGLGKQQITDAVFWAIVGILTFSVMQMVAKNDAVYPEVSRNVILFP